MLWYFRKGERKKFDHLSIQRIHIIVPSYYGCVYMWLTCLGQTKSPSKKHETWEKKQCSVGVGKEKVLSRISLAGFAPWSD